jgi:hypothetical protein
MAHNRIVYASAFLPMLAVFHIGWFVESPWSQTLVIHKIRTPKIPFIHSRASCQLALLTTLGIATGTFIPYTWLGMRLCIHHLPPVYYLWLVGMIFAYMLLAMMMKNILVWKLRGVVVGGKPTWSIDTSTQKNVIYFMVSNFLEM